MKKHALYIDKKKIINNNNNRQVQYYRVSSIRHRIIHTNQYNGCSLMFSTCTFSCEFVFTRNKYFGFRYDRGGGEIVFRCGFNTNFHHQKYDNLIRLF